MVAHPPSAPSSTSDELIVMENDPGPFCGRCDTVKLTVSSDGRAWIEHGYWAGNYRDRRVERRLEHVLPANLARFREHLRPYRPRGEISLQEKPACDVLWYDVDGVRVEWRDANRTDRLILNFGCDPAVHRRLAEALRVAPDLLGIPTLKMPWNQWLVATPS
jgi:hypothetical protein